MAKASAIMNRIGTGLLGQSKDESSHRKDLLSVLAQASKLKMNEKEVMSRAYNPLSSGIFTHILSEISTFITAGHETSRYTCPQTFCN